MTLLHATTIGLLGALLLGRDQVARAHRSLPSGLTCGAQFGSPDAPLVVPNPAISWANYGIYTCDDPIQWYEATTVDAGQLLHFTLTVPEIERFREARMTAAIVGPGLPEAEDAAGRVPDAVMDYTTANGLGIAVFDSPEDQSTCGHLTSKLMFNSSTVKDGRCHFYEPFGGSNLWVVLDEWIAAPVAGAYKITVYETNGMTARRPSPAATGRKISSPGSTSPKQGATSAVPPRTTIRRGRTCSTSTQLWPSTADIPPSRSATGARPRWSLLGRTCANKYIM